METTHPNPLLIKLLNIHDHIIIHLTNQKNIVLFISGFTICHFSLSCISLK